MARFILPTVHRLGQPAAFHSMLSSMSARGASPKLSPWSCSRHRSLHALERVEVRAALREGVAAVQAAWDPMDDCTHRARAAVGWSLQAQQP